MGGIYANVTEHVILEILAYFCTKYPSNVKRDQTSESEIYIKTKTKTPDTETETETKLL